MHPLRGLLGNCLAPLLSLLPESGGPIRGQPIPADQPTHDRPGVIPPSAGQLNPLSTENPPPTAHLIETLPAVQVVDVAGTTGKGGEEATLRVGEGAAGHGCKAIRRA